MSHVTFTPQSSQSGAATQVAAEGEHPGWLAVRKMLDAYAEREVQKIRWSAVMAGLFLALGTEILLGCLGAAIGLTTDAPGASGLLSRFGRSAGVFTMFTSLLSTFVGGYAAAKLGGTIRKGDGVVSGTLTWATSLVLCLWLALQGMSVAALSGFNVQHVLRAGQGALSAAADKSAWFMFGGALLSLLSAMLGGAAGAVGTACPGGDRGARRRDIRKQAEQSEGEQARHDQQL